MKDENNKTNISDNDESIRNVVSDAAKSVVTETVKRNPKLAIIIPAIIVGVLLVAGGVFYFGHKLNWGKRVENDIEKTANVVSEINKIKELTTACFYEELAIKEVRYDTIRALKSSNNTPEEERSKIKDIFKKMSDKITGTAAKVTRSSNEIVLIGKGKVRAGFDLAKIEEKDIRIKNDTLYVTLPPVELFDIIMNPSDFTTEYENGKWSHELVRPIKEKAKEQLEKDAIECGLLDNSKESCVTKLTEMFKTFGFKTVYVTVQGELEITETKDA